MVDKCNGVTGGSGSGSTNPAVAALGAGAAAAALAKDAGKKRLSGEGATPQSKDSSDRAEKRKKKKNYYAKLKKEEDDKMAELASKYRDRSVSRRACQAFLIDFMGAN